MRVLIAIAILSLVGPALANDGRDRYRAVAPDGGPTLLMLFPEPASPAWGYRVLARDMPGGADGQRAFRWARPEAIALVRLAARRTQERFPQGAGREMAIFDLSAENGDTPVDFGADHPPRGRHPGGSHDGGINLDLGYFLKSLEGKRYTPDLAACTRHFLEVEKGPEGIAPRDAYRCLGAADRLDTAKQVTFLMALFRLDQELFAGEWIEQIGVDEQVRRAILGALPAGREGGEAVAKLRRAMTAERFEGWSGSHHHHIHLRLRPLSIHGSHSRGFAELMRRELALDRKLAGRDGLPFLRARLLSRDLDRAVELTVIGARGITEVTFGTDQTGAASADPFYGPLWRAVIDLPDRYVGDGGSLRCEARLISAGGRVQILHSSLILPRREPALRLFVDPGQLQPTLSRDPAGGAGLSLALSAASQALVTGVQWEVLRGEGPPERIPGSGRNYRAGFVKLSEVRLVLARIVLSGRMSLSLPVYWARPQQTSTGP